MYTYINHGSEKHENGPTKTETLENGQALFETYSRKKINRKIRLLVDFPKHI